MLSSLKNLGKNLQQAPMTLCNLRPHSSTAIEGNSLTLVKEIRKIQETGDSSSP